ncbi:MAG: APC family permease, partial [Solirubrobacterales bacterium]
MARRVPRDQGLRRILGASALYSAAYGNVGSSIYYALGVTAAFALGLTPVAFLIAGLIFICTAATYAEGTVMYPEAGGSSSFARHAFNELVSFIAAWGQMLNYTITAAISAYFVPHYLAVFWAPLGSAPGDIIAGAVVILALAALNIRGAEESTRFNLVLTILDIATQVVLVAIGVFLVLSPEVLVSNVQLGIAPTWPDFALGIAVGMIAYTGIETISNMSEEARDAARTVPQGVILVVITVLALYAFIPIVALSAMPVVQLPDGSFVTELGTTYADDPILGIVENLGVSGALKEGLKIYVGLLAAVILLIATNAGMIGVSRLSYSMGQHRQLPEAIRRVHPRYRTPYIAIAFFAVAAIVTILPGRAEFLATLYSFGAMLSFTIAHAAVIRMRKTEPDAVREWMPPLNFRFRGTLLPLTAVIGGLGTFLAWIVVMALNPVTLLVGSLWMAIGIVVYLLYRRYQNLPLRETVTVVMPEPLGVEEIEYRSVVVGLRPGEVLSDE